MKIKRYFASDMRQAMRMVREEQGADAVILSNRQVDGGIEIIAALDFDEASLRQQAAQRPPESAHDMRDVSSRHQVSMQESVSADPFRTSSPQVNVAAPVPPPAVNRYMTDAPFVQSHIDTNIRAEPEPAERTTRSTATRTQWLQDPLISEMRDEIKGMKDLLQSQVAGLAWGDVGRRHPLRARLLRQLMQYGMSADVARQIATTVPEDMEFERATKLALQLLINKISITSDDILDQGGVVALVGPTGVGKTTTIAKLAARYALRHGKERVALVTTDNYRIGAHEQLRTFARILGVPLHTAKDASDLASIVADLADKELVLIDTAGMSQRDVRLSEQLALLRGSARTARNYLVMSATSQLHALHETVRAFSAADIRGCIITKTDESASLGDVLSVIIRHGLPVSYVSNGQKVPEDIHPARAENLVHQCVELAQSVARDVDDAMLELSYGRMAVNAHI